MRQAFYKFLSSLPSRLVGGGGQALSIGASLWPERIKQWLGEHITPEHIRMVAVPCAAIFAVYWLLVWWLKPKETERPAQPTYGSGSQFFVAPVAHVGDVFNLAPKDPPKPETSLVMRANFLPYEYVEGIERCGILWRSGFAHVQMQILNLSEIAFENVSILIQLDFPIAVGSATSDLTDVRIGSAFRFGGPIVLADTGDGKLRVAASDGPDSESQYLDPVYRLFCASMPAKSDIRVDLAVAQAADIDQPGDIFLPTAPTPTRLLLEAEYVAYRERRTQAQEIAL